MIWPTVVVGGRIFTRTVAPASPFSGGVRRPLARLHSFHNDIYAMNYPSSAFRIRCRRWLIGALVGGKPAEREGELECKAGAQVRLTSSFGGDVSSRRNPRASPDGPISKIEMLKIGKNKRAVGGRKEHMSGELYTDGGGHIRAIIVTLRASMFCMELKRIPVSRRQSEAHGGVTECLLSLEVLDASRLFSQQEDSCI
nr:hypothetical protein Iba_chr02fCG12830 [Ipomoea batatas]